MTSNVLTFPPKKSFQKVVRQEIVNTTTNNKKFIPTVPFTIIFREERLNSQVIKIENSFFPRSREYSIVFLHVLSKHFKFLLLSLTLLGALLHMGSNGNIQKAIKVLMVLSQHTTFTLDGSIYESKMKPKYSPLLSVSFSAFTVCFSQKLKLKCHKLLRKADRTFV